MTNELLRHTLATIGYRFQKAVSNSTEDFGDFKIGNNTRTPNEIICHMYEVLSATRKFILEEKRNKEQPDKLELGLEIDRFNSELKNLDNVLAIKELEINYSKRLLQGPFSDVLTHIGQISMLSGLNGNPIKGEDFSSAPIATGMNYKSEKQNNVSKELISRSSIDINASSPKIWEVLVKPEIAKEYFFGAEIVTDWKVGSPITFKGEFNGNIYEEKGVLLNVEPNAQLQYSHWSNFDGLPDESENYRTWTFDLIEKEGTTKLSITEDNIPTEKQKNRSDEFWSEALLKIKRLVEK